MPQFVEGLQRAYPDILFCDYRSMNVDYENRSEHDEVINGVRYRVIPLRWANEIFGREYKFCMKSKFDLFELDYRTWKGNAWWARDREKEIQLARLIVHENPFILVNEHFQSDAKGRKKIIPNTDKNVIYMGEIEGYSIFDWFLILQMADEIHTVSTSLLYILELITLPESVPIHLYSRPTDPNFDQVSYLFTKPYILHYD